MGGPRRDARARLLAGTVLVDGPWTAALDLVLARPDVTVVTMAGDRFGGRGAWVAGGGAVSGVTRATLDEARDRAGQAAAERTRADGSLRAARDQLAAVGGDVDERLVEVTRRRREVDVRVATLAERREMLAARLGAVEERLAAQDNDAQADAERARAALSRRATAYEELAGRIARHREAADALHDRLEERRRARPAGAVTHPARAGRRVRGAGGPQRPPPRGRRRAARPPGGAAPRPDRGRARGLRRGAAPLLQ